MRRSILAIVCLMAAAAQAVTYSPYTGRGIYTTTERLEHEQVSMGTPAMSFASTSAMSATTPRANQTAELNSNVNIVAIQLPAIRLHDKNVEAQAEIVITDNSSGPRRVGPVNPGEGDKEFLLGDALSPLLFFALVYCLLGKYKSIRKKSKSHESLFFGR